MNSITTNTPSNRIDSLDIMRGAIMILMALDHCRDFFHVDAFKFSPEDLSQTNIPLFMTRWITHLCAPMFALLAGISVALYEQKKLNKKDTFYYLITRGIWLIILEITVIRFGWGFYVDYSSIGGLVIWALGWSMIFLAFLICLDKKSVLIASISIIFFHNMFDNVSFPNHTWQNLIWAFFHQSKFIPVTDSFGINILYPVLPVFGLMGLGYYIGNWYQKDFGNSLRKSLLIYTGISCIFLFIILRIFGYFNLHFGEPKTWEIQNTIEYTLLSFINVSKYPMSLLYILITIGPSLILLGIIPNHISSKNLLNKVKTIGRVPLFYYIVHLYLIHLLFVIFVIISHLNQLKNFDLINTDWKKLTNDYGFSLWGVYLAWFTVILFIYPLCKYYNGVKSKKSSIIFRYL